MVKVGTNEGNSTIELVWWKSGNPGECQSSKLHTTQKYPKNEDFILVGGQLLSGDRQTAGQGISICLASVGRLARPPAVCRLRFPIHDFHLGRPVRSRLGSIFPYPRSGIRPDRQRRPRSLLPITKATDDGDSSRHLKSSPPNDAAADVHPPTQCPPRQSRMSTTETSISTTTEQVARYSKEDSYHFTRPSRDPFTTPQGWLFRLQCLSPPRQSQWHSRFGQLPTEHHGSFHRINNSRYRRWIELYNTTDGSHGPTAGR